MPPPVSEKNDKTHKEFLVKDLTMAVTSINSQVTVSSSPCKSGYIAIEPSQIPECKAQFPPRVSFFTRSPNFTADTSVHKHNLNVTVKFWGYYLLIIRIYFRKSN